MRRILVAALAAAGVLTPATAASADTPKPPESIGVRLLDAPTDRRNDPWALAYVIDHVAPGATIQRRIEVSNTTSKPADVSVYPAAASIVGGVFTGADGNTPNELSTWTSVDRGTVPLAPGAKQPVTVVIRVPKDAAPGEQYAVVWAQVSSAPAATDNITAVNRVGIRVYLSVGPGGEPASDFAVDTLTAERNAAGAPVVRAQVHNTGGRALDMNGTLALSGGPGGLNAGPFPAQLGTTLAVRETGSVVIPLDASVPDGPWHAVIKLSSGLLSRTAEATITFPRPSAPAAAPAPATAVAPVAPVAAPPAPASTIPWVPIIVGAGLLLLLLLLWFLLARRRSRDSGGRHSGRPEQPLKPA